jgi:hypothetical protein
MTQPTDHTMIVRRVATCSFAVKESECRVHESGVVS